MAKNLMGLFDFNSLNNLNGETLAREIISLERVKGQKYTEKSIREMLNELNLTEVEKSNFYSTYNK